uniref:Uncharacterized protein n=1 Tax=Ceratitis capitata TaxID=7213 RepID=W8B4B6_CERCA
MRVDSRNHKSKPKAIVERATAALPTQSATQPTGSNPLGFAKKKSCTTLLCELTHLKSQQKYLECSQVKLIAANFEDLPPATVGGLKKSSAFMQPSQLINEIETVKQQLNEDLKVYRENCYREVQELRYMINAIREDVQPQRLSQCTLPALRERIINVNTQLMQLCDKNNAEMVKLRDEFENLDRDNEILIKF